MGNFSSALGNETRDTTSTPAAATKTRARAKVDYIDYFRGVSILLIIAGHAFDLGWTRSGNEHSLDSVRTLNVLSALLTGGTFFFVFISGFLYRHVFYERMAYGDFLRKKAVQVGVPYLILGTAITLFHIQFSGAHVTIYKHGAELGENHYVDLAVMLATGNMMTAYWYIPFIFVVFLASPLFDAYIRLANGPKVLILVASLLLAFWVHRPYEGLNPFHSFLYFANIYLFGILFCENREKWMAFLTRRSVLLALAAGVLAVAYAEDVVLHKVTDLERTARDGWMPLGFDLMILQKYLGILFFCGALARWGHLAARPLVLMAELSFGMYFMHGIVLAAMTHAPSWLSPHSGSSVVDFVAYSLVAIALSISCVVAIKLVTGRHSRTLIGA